MHDGPSPTGWAFALGGCAIRRGSPKCDRFGTRLIEPAPDALWRSGETTRACPDHHRPGSWPPQHGGVRPAGSPSGYRPPRVRRLRVGGTGRSDRRRRLRPANIPICGYQTALLKLKCRSGPPRMVSTLHNRPAAPLAALSRKHGCWDAGMWGRYERRLPGAPVHIRTCGITAYGSCLRSNASPRSTPSRPSCDLTSPKCHQCR